MGDPACDATIAWTFFFGESRDAFGAGLTLYDATWARGRNWALIMLVDALKGTPEQAESIRSVTDEVLAERARGITHAHDLHRRVAGRREEQVGRGVSPAAPNAAETQQTITFPVDYREVVQVADGGEEDWENSWVSSTGWSACWRRIKTMT